MKKKKKKHKKCKAKARAAAKRLRDKHNRFAPAANISDEEIVTRLLKKKMREVPKIIPLALLSAGNVPNKRKLPWSAIVASHLVLLAATSKDVGALKLLFERTEGTVPETMLHSLDEYSPELIETIRKLLGESKR